MELNLHQIASQLLGELETENLKNQLKAEGVRLLYERIRDAIRANTGDGEPKKAEEQVSNEAAPDAGAENP